jgi:hypothetical protein
VSDRTETAIIVLVLGACAFALSAPLVGRLGAPAWADLVMAGAVACGLAATALAARHTLRAARRAPVSERPDRRDA